MSFIKEYNFRSGDVLVSLARGGVDFALMGGLAVGVNGGWEEGQAKELSLEDFATFGRKISSTYALSKNC